MRTAALTLQSDKRPNDQSNRAEWFDGKSSRSHPVVVSVSGDLLHITGDGIHKQYPLADIQWPERTEAGSRTLKLPDDSSLLAQAGTNWAALAAQAGVSETALVRWQQSTRLALVAAVLVVATGFVGYVWGVPALARGALTFVPHWVDKKIGETFLTSIGPRLVGPSNLAPARQAQIRRQFSQLVAASYAPNEVPDYELSFHSSKVGPNAFALPGGHIIMTDQLVGLAHDQPDMVLGVLAHELGHVRHRHGMKMISQSLLVGTITAVALGDYGELVATVPLLLGQTAYSREFEREADTQSIEMLLAGGKSPAVMAAFFRRLGTFSGRPRPPATPDSEPAAPAPAGKDQSETHPSAGPSSLGILLSSHPATSERIARFEAAR